MYEVIAEDKNETPRVIYRTESFEEAHVVRAENASANARIKEVTVVEDDA